MKKISNMFSTKNRSFGVTLRSSCSLTDGSVVRGTWRALHGRGNRKLWFVLDSNTWLRWWSHRVPSQSRFPELFPLSALKDLIAISTDSRHHDCLWIRGYLLSQSVITSGLLKWSCHGDRSPSAITEATKRPMDSKPVSCTEPHKWVL